MYTKKVLDHFTNPRNVGEIPDASGIGQYGDPVCGDFLRVYIKVKDNRLSDVKFLIQGCPAAMATSSIMTEIAIGKTLEEALKIMMTIYLRLLHYLKKNPLLKSGAGV